VAVPLSRFLDPAALAALGDLELIARTVVEGYLSGRHLLPQAGFGIEFAQYRSYDPGDDLRRIDWKAYARSDRFYVRQSEVERDVTVRFVLDASGSMAHHDGRITKLDYARMLIAGLAYIAHRQGDRLALHVVSGAGCVDLAPRGRRPLLELLHHLEGVEPEGTWPPFAELEGHLVTGRARELVIVVSDLYDSPTHPSPRHGSPSHDAAPDGPEGSIDRALRNLRALGHEVLVLQVTSRNERELDVTGDVVFRDLETGEEVSGSAEAMRAAWQAGLAAEHRRWRDRLLEFKVAHALVDTEEPFEHALTEFLLHRADLPA
jgi:uncharacterized protein (DUF58 family)